MTAPSDFRVGVTGDFLKPDGTLGFGDIGLELFEQAGVPWEFFNSHGGEIAKADADRFDAMLVLTPRVTRSTVESTSRLKLVARFGVGYDNVDVPACTESGVLVTITPDGVRRPVAVAALTFLLALSHKLRVKDELTRAGRWGEKLAHTGQGVTGRTLGIIGFGNIGREIARMCAPLDMKMIAFDPYFNEAAGQSLGVASASLDDLLRNADYVVIACALTESTRHLINAERLATMRPNAYLINVARGPIVDQKALTQCLIENRIAGAGLDVFEVEPISPDDPLLKLDNVIVAPHALCWTDECFRLIGKDAIGSIIDVAQGREPKHVVNRDALKRFASRNTRQV
jgi:phosphoglycerate dehydrogenase-like enzyme